MTMLTIPYSKHQFDTLETQAVVDILENGWIARGPKIAQFEQLFSQTLDFNHSVACTNGSVAIEIALRAAGIGPGDEVIVPTLTWASTATSVSIVGATPVFADINLSDYCISCETIASLITPSTKAIIVVHFAGISANMNPIWDLAESYGLQVIEDCAHSIGGSYLSGESIGSSTRSYACTFSLHPAKNITTAEGGVIATSCRATAEKLMLYRSGGICRSGDDSLKKAFYDIQVVSSNYHITDIQAAIGIVQLRKLKRFVDIRTKQIDRYNTNLSIIQSLAIHSHPSSSAGNLYIPLLPCFVDRDKVFMTLNSMGIGAYYHYPLIHRASLYSLPDHNFPNACNYSRRAITLPLGPHLTLNDIDKISDALLNILRSF